MPVNANHPRQRGFSMIEVLVAILVVSVGLLGIAGLQAYGLQANHSAYLRSQATVLAYDALDRMRANIDAATAGAYNLTMSDSPSGSGSIATSDLSEWMTNIQTTLPSGDGEINVDSSGMATVKVQWLDDKRKQETQTFEVDTQL